MLMLLLRLLQNTLDDDGAKMIIVFRIITEVRACLRASQQSAVCTLVRGAVNRGLAE